MAITLRAVFFQVLPIVATTLILITSLILLSISTDDPQQSGKVSEWLIPLNVVILLVLSGLIVYNVAKALKLLRSGQAGSRFTLKLMYAFTLITIAPVLIVSYFSMNFIGDRIDNWFNIKIEGALDDSLELARSSLDVRMRQHLFDLERAATALAGIDELDYANFIDKQLHAMGAYEIVLLNNNKKVLVYSGDDLEKILPHFPADHIFRTISTRGYMYQLEPIGKDGLFSRVALTLSPGIGRDSLVLTALFPFSEKELILAENVQDTYTQYQEISYQRNLMKKGFRMTLLLIMLLSILFALWAAFLYSLRLTKPIRTLLEGTMAVASGDLQKKLPIVDKDDFSLLARSFNTMTARLSTAQQESEKSQQQMTRQHDYLNIILDNLTSGVIALDDNFIIRRINAAAEQLFLISLKKYVGTTFSSACFQAKDLSTFYEAVLPYLETTEENKVWQTEVLMTLDNVKHTLVCRGSVLPELIDGTQGYVLVFDDISEVIQAEHDAAWSEVARRLAHEIKNPLTPIQLSAERLQHRIKPLLDDKSAELLQRMSSTIINQVDTMKNMVNAFSEYARTPELKLNNLDINHLIREVSELYRMSQTHAKITLELQNSPILYADSDRIRQLLINLIKNALESMQNNVKSSEERGSVVTISTKIEEPIDNKVCEFMLIISDTGTGINEDLLPHLFEPYRTTKTKGTGLGLAIVKRIVEEHDGQVIAKNNHTVGASIHICFPLSRQT